MQSFQDICTKFAQIVNGKASMEHGVCSVKLNRNLNVKIQGRPSRSALHAGITFESLDIYGNALNLGEVVVLQRNYLHLLRYLQKII